MNNEIIFLIEDDPEQGFIAKALGHSIFTEADTLIELKENIKDAVNCHFDKKDAPKVIRLHYVKEEFLTI